MTVADAVHAHPDGVALDVEVMPAAKENVFPAGYNMWRKRIQARVAAPPTEGQANDSLLALVAEFFGAPRRSVRLLDGEKSRRKRILVAGVAVEDAVRRLEA